MLEELRYSGNELYMRRPLWLVVILTLVTIATAFFAQVKPAKYPDPIQQALNDFAFTHKWWIIAALITVSVIINSWGGFFAEPRGKLRRIREAILEDMRSELFDNEKTELRITIFRKANWWMARYIWVQVFIMTCNRRARGRKKSTRMKPRKIFQYRFVHITQRIGTEYNNSGTFFHYNPATREDCESVASHVMQTGDVVTKRDLPDIRALDLSALHLDGPMPAQVHTYLLETYSTPATVKRLHVIARHFHAVPLVNPKTSARVGVLVIDSVQERCPFDKPSVQRRIDDYATMLNRTL